MSPMHDAAIRSPLIDTRSAWYLRAEVAPPGGATALLRLLGVEGAPLPDSAGETAVATRRVRAGQSLFHEGARADALHFIGVGTFKTVHLAEDGYEQVLAFNGRGEVLGYDALYTGMHPTAAVALEDSTVYGVTPADLSTLGRSVPGVEQALQRELSRQLAQRAVIANLMAAVSAEVRLARFLVHLSARMAESGQSPRRMLLRMSRRDIASHIGVAHETVSRSFSALVQWGCLAVSNREVEILDAQRLQACARSTRGLVEAASGCVATRTALGVVAPAAAARCAA